MGNCCPTCNQKILEHKHKLSAPLVQALFSVWAHARRGPVKVKALGLDHPQQANLQKLGYWNLVEKSHDQKTMLRIGGCWNLTEDGVEFLKGKLRVPSYRWTYQADVLPRKDSEHMRDIFEIWDGYELPEEWAARAHVHGAPEVEPQLSLEMS